jgi:uncharacterized protein YjbI with pentapeptide repeats
MGDGTKENPYTREDMLRLIKENGDTAEGLDLSGKVFEKGIDLKGLRLQRIILKEAVLQDAHFEEAKLWGAHLEKADLQYAHLEEVDLSEAQLQEATLLDAFLNKATLFGANLEGAFLMTAHLEGADLGGANLKGTQLWGAKFSSDTNWENVDWGDYILADEKELQEAKGEEREEVLARLEVDNIYRRLRLWYTNAGMSDVAAKFYYREKEVDRKVASRWNDRAAGWLSWAVFGHGEGWKRIIFWIAGFVLLFALIYFAIGTLTPNTFLNSLYYSAVSFVALGYGSWVKEATGWVKGLGVFETFLGFFMMTLLLVTFVRKWTR